MLYLIATPIGNLKDITLRAIETLKEADVIVCEDTRETIKLLKAYQVPPKPLVSFYEEVENQKMPEILKLVQNDTKVVLVSDAGTPLISDPGYKLVREAIKNGVKVEVLPGPSAVTTALIMSGLPPDKFTFWGFPLKNKIREAEGTNIYFVSPHKLLKFLKVLKEDKEIVICREMTKIYEERWQGIPRDGMVKFKKPRGEFVLLWHN